MERLTVEPRSRDERLRQQAIVLEDKVWAPLGFLSHTQAHSRDYGRLLDQYADLQLCLLDEETGETLALANCVPAMWDLSDTSLPIEGWDWIVADGGRGQDRGMEVLAGLAISVPMEHRGKGYAQRMIVEMRNLRDRLGYRALILPVRPSAKCHHPEVSMDSYLGWKDDRGRVYDPWLRSHLSAQGRLVGICERSMVVDQSIDFWEEWSVLPFETSGSHVVDGALVPVEIDIVGGRGVYEEPNVWITYQA
jgi:hypothetical protein